MTTTLVPTSPRPHAVSVPAARRWAFAGALWSAGFAAVHVYWAAGGRWGIPHDVGAISSRPAFLAYDVAAAAIFAVAGMIGLLLATPTGGGRHRMFLVHLALVGGVAGLLRGGLGLLQDGTNAMTGTEVLPVGLVADVWFTVAGCLFVLVAVRLRSTARIVSASRR